MIAPMLAGVVYFSTLPDFVRVLYDCNIRRVYFHSFWALVNEVKVEKDRARQVHVDCHCLAGLTSFANAFKMVIHGKSLLDRDDMQVIANRKLVGVGFRKLWQPKGGLEIRLVVGQVVDSMPPQSAWVPIDDFLAGKVPAEFPVVRYTQSESGDK